MIYVIATVTVKPETRADFIKHAHAVIAGSQAEAGCLHYDLGASVTEPETFYFVERWESREILGHHFEAPHSKVWKQVSAGYVTKAVVEIISPKDVETR